MEGVRHDHASSLGNKGGMFSVEWRGRKLWLSWPVERVVARHVVLFQSYLLEQVGKNLLRVPDHMKEMLKVEDRVREKSEAILDRIEKGELGFDSPEYDAWKKTVYGGACFVLASLEVKQPDFTLEDVYELIAEQGTEVLQKLRAMAPKGVVRPVGEEPDGQPSTPPSSTPS